MIPEHKRFLFCAQSALLICLNVVGNKIAFPQSVPQSGVSTGVRESQLVTLVSADWSHHSHQSQPTEPQAHKSTTQTENAYVSRA